MFNHVECPTLPEIKRKTILDKRFYVTPEGKEYLSITTNLGMVEKPFLNAWRKRLGIKAATEETERCSIRGEAVHDMAEKYLKNVPDPTKGHNKQHIREFNQIKLRLNEIDNIKAQEIFMWSDVLETAGAVDCIGEYDGRLSIIDFKTSNFNKTKDMIEDYFLQLTAYSLMWYERTGENIEDIVVLMSSERGAFPLIFKEKTHKYIKPLTKRLKQGKKLWLEYLEKHQTQNDSSEQKILLPNK